MHAMNNWNSHFESQYCGGSCTPPAFLHPHRHDIIRNKRQYALHPAQVISSLFSHLLNVQSLLRPAYRRIKYYCSRAVLRDTAKLALDPCHSKASVSGTIYVYHNVPAPEVAVVSVYSVLG